MLRQRGQPNPMMTRASAHVRKLITATPNSLMITGDHVGEVIVALSSSAEPSNRRQHVIQRGTSGSAGPLEVAKGRNPEAAVRQGVQSGIYAACEHGIVCD
jgi:hypothetical protein